MQLGCGEKLLFIGDSVTDCDRNRPVGEGPFSLGNGYVAQVDALLRAAYPHLGVRVVNMGIGGHTVRDLKARWQRDVLDLRPDWLAVMIGINDVWRQFDMPLVPETHVYIDEYEATLHDLLAQTRPQVKGLVLMTPFFIEPNQQDAMRATMDRYGHVMRRVAATHHAICVDTQAAFDRVLQHADSASLSHDRVHPNQAGHMVLARTFLNAVDFSWSGQA